jgi:hypothetical protein
VSLVMTQFLQPGIERLCGNPFCTNVQVPPHTDLTVMEILRCATLR